MIVSSIGSSGISAFVCCAETDARADRGVPASGAPTTAETCPDVSGNGSASASGDRAGAQGSSAGSGAGIAGTRVTGGAVIGGSGRRRTPRERATTGGGGDGGSGAAGRTGTAEIGAGAAESAPVTSLVTSLTAPRSNPPHRPACASGCGSKPERPATGGGGASNDAGAATDARDRMPIARPRPGAPAAESSRTPAAAAVPEASTGGSGSGREGVYAGGAARGT